MEYLATLSFILAIMGAREEPGSDPVPEAPQIPEVLGKGTVSLPDRYEFCSTLSHDFKTLYIGVEHGSWQSIEAYRFTARGWDGPHHVFGTPEYPAQDPYLSADGKRLYFITAKDGHGDIGYLSQSSEGNWGNPILLDQPVNGPANEYFLSFSKARTLVFASDRADAESGDYDIFAAVADGDKFAPPAMIEGEVNSEWDEGDPFIDPEGRFLIFASNRPGGAGRGDLYISMASENGSWLAPIAFGDSINTSGHELCPALSRDGSIFMFTSNRDIHWVSAKVIFELTRGKAGEP